jgi:hypothetical protein
MAKRGRHPMLPDDGDSPISILKILTEERTDRFSHEIRRSCTGRQKDLSPLFGKTVVELIILITHQHFIIESNCFKDFFAKHRIAGPLGIALEVRVAMSGVANPYRMGHGGSHGLTEHAPPCTDDRPTDTGYLRVFSEQFNTDL